MRPKFDLEKTFTNIEPKILQKFPFKELFYVFPHSFFHLLGILRSQSNDLIKTPIVVSFYIYLDSRSSTFFKQKGERSLLPLEGFLKCQSDFSKGLRSNYYIDLKKKSILIEFATEFSSVCSEKDFNKCDLEKSCENIEIRFCTFNFVFKHSIALKKWFKKRKKYINQLQKKNNSKFLKTWKSTHSVRR